MKRILWVVALILVTCGGLSAQRLPETVIPDSYRITFTPDLAKATFAGEETIRVQVRQQAPSITLSSGEIDFQKGEVSRGRCTQISKGRGHCRGTHTEGDRHQGR